jgi:hypothetical protein
MYSNNQFKEVGPLLPIAAEHDNACDDDDLDHSYDDDDDDDGTTMMMMMMLFGQLVFYLEACESGSMFMDIDTNINIYTTTASSPYESSYACYYDNVYMTYVGDCYR